MKKISFKTVIYSGENALDYLMQLNGKRIFIVTDPFIIESGMIAEIEARLSKGNNEWQLFSEIIPDPPIENVVAGVSKMGAFRPDIILAVGGGSAIDAAKAMKKFAYKVYQGEMPELIAVPTTSGTGSEVTAFSVITDNEKEIKYPLVSDDLVPDTAILDTNLVKTVPKEITADTGMDALTHAIEAIVALHANDFTDALAEKAIRFIFTYLETAYKDGSNIMAREKVHHASTLAGIAFNTAGLGINHSMAHASGARFHIAHGRLNTILLPHVIAYNAGIQGYNSKNLQPAAEKYQEIAQILGLPASTPASGTRSLMREIKKLATQLDMPKDLKGYALSADNETIEQLAKSAIADRCTATNPRKPIEADIVQILKAIL